MLKFYQLALIGMLLFVQGNLAAQSLLSPNQLREDLLHIKKSLLNYHPDLFAYQSRSKFENSFGEVAQQLDQAITENEFFRLVKPLVTQVKCGHTDLYHSEKYILNQQKVIFPIEVEVNNSNEIEVIDTYTSQVPKGAIITKIDDLASDKIVEVLLGFISSDGLHQNGRYYNLNNQFFSLYAEVLAENITIDITYQFNGQTKSTQLLPKIERSSLQEKPPLVEAAIKGNAAEASLKIRSFDKALLKENGIHLKKFLNNFFEEVQEQQVKKLTIDLRDNIGGNDLLAIELYRYIAKKPFKFYDNLRMHKKSKKQLGFPHNIFFRIEKADSLGMVSYTGHKGLKWIIPTKNYFLGEVEVLINGGTMSAAAHFAAKCHNNQRANILGQASAGNYEGSNSGFLIYETLPHSGLQLFIPAIRYELYLPNKKLITEAIEPSTLAVSKSKVAQ